MISVGTIILASIVNTWITLTLSLINGSIKIAKRTWYGSKRSPWIPWLIEEYSDQAWAIAASRKKSVGTIFAYARSLNQGNSFVWILDNPIISEPVIYPKKIFFQLTSTFLEILIKKKNFNKEGLKFLNKIKSKNIAKTFNLGSGEATSIIDVCKKFNIKDNIKLKKISKKELSITKANINKIKILIYPYKSRYI